MRTVAAGLLAALLASPAAAQNATGQPAISGIHEVGRTLTASTDGLADPEGLANATFAYRWIRVDGSLETDIDGATSSTYTLAAADVGSQIKVAASFADDSGNPEERVSAAFPDKLLVLERAACTVEPYHRSWGRELLATTLIVGTSGHQLTPVFGFQEGVHGDLIKKRFQRPDENPSDYDAASLKERTITELWGFANGWSWAFKPGWVSSTSSADSDVLRVCGETVHANDLFVGEALANFLSYESPRLELSRFASVEVRYYFDDAPPEAVEARVRGTELKIVFSEKVLLGSTEVVDWSVPNRVVLHQQASGRIVTLTLDRPVTAPTTVSKRGRYLLDFANNEVASGMNSLNVRLVRKPTLQSQVLAADGAALTLTFDEDLDGASVPPAGAFTVRVGGARRALAPVNPVSVSGRTVVLRLAKPAGAGEAVTVAYEKPNPN